MLFAKVLGSMICSMHTYDKRAKTLRHYCCSLSLSLAFSFSVTPPLDKGCCLPLDFFTPYSLPVFPLTKATTTVLLSPPPLIEIATKKLNHWNQSIVALVKWLNPFSQNSEFLQTKIFISVEVFGQIYRLVRQHVDQRFQTEWLISILNLFLWAFHQY